MDNLLTRRVTGTFANLAGASPQLIVRAPGRVNLIGEHTDYNGGFVLPCTISLETQIASTRRADTTVQIVAADFGNKIDNFDLAHKIVPSSDNPWANYIRGVFKVLQDRGHQLGGVDLAVAGTIPLGAGLSSSASLSVAVALTLKHLWNLQGIDATDLALIAQTSESEFVGCQCGIMDQLVSARGDVGHAILIDCESLTTQPVPLPADLAIMIVHSGISRGLVDGKYNERRAQCERAALQLGVAQLRHATLPQLNTMRTDMDDVVFRRARHVITENARALKAAELLASGNLHDLRELLAESHASMKHDFEITVPGIDQLVDILQTAIGNEGGARMTGGGFGGAVVALMPTSSVASVQEAVLTSYRTPEGGQPVVMIESAVACAGVIDVHGLFGSEAELKPQASDLS